MTFSRALPMPLKSIFFVFILLLPAMVFADPAVDKPYEKGVKEFLKGDYSNAIFHFEDALKADKENGGDDDPVIPLNLSICYEKIGNLPKALDFAKEAQNGDLGEVADKNASRIAVFRRILNARVSAEKMERVNKNETLCESNDHCEAGLICGESGACVVDSNIEYEEQRFGTIGYIGSGLLVVSAGLFAYALLEFDAEVGDIEEKLKDKTLTNAQAQKLEEDQTNARSTGLILLFAGAGTAALGLGLLVYDLSTVDKVPVAFSPVLTPDRVGANFSFQF